jgi:hypothetical protein
VILGSYTCGSRIGRGEKFVGSHTDRPSRRSPHAPLLRYTLMASSIPISLPINSGRRAHVSWALRSAHLTPRSRGSPGSPGSGWLISPPCSDTWLTWVWLAQISPPCSVVARLTWLVSPCPRPCRLWRANTSILMTLKLSHAACKSRVEQPTRHATRKVLSTEV